MRFLAACFQNYSTPVGFFLPHANGCVKLRTTLFLFGTNLFRVFPFVRAIVLSLLLLDFSPGSPQNVFFGFPSCTLCSLVLVGSNRTL